MTTKIKCLDHGFVELVDVMGDDQAIVDAARVSVSGEDVKTVQDNTGLIRYLMRNRHTTPFEMVELKFRCKMPMFIARQWVRHRTANINEMSARYSKLPNEYYVPAEEDIQFQATVNKQGRNVSAGMMPVVGFQQTSFKEEAANSFDLYERRLEDGMAKELARINLPLSSYTQWIWKIDLHNLFHFLSLRAHPHAQMEIRVYAEAMLEMIKPIVPIACAAFEDYRMKAAFLTKQDMQAIRAILGEGNDDLAAMFGADRIADLGDLFPTKREFDEFKSKWAALLSE